VCMYVCMYVRVYVCVAPSGSITVELLACYAIVLHHSARAYNVSAVQM